MAKTYCNRGLFRLAGLLTALAILLGACEARRGLPQETGAAATQPAQASTPTTQTPQSTPAAKTPAPGPSRTPPPAETVSVPAGELKGAQVEFWYGLEGPAAQAIQDLIGSFNTANEWGIRVSGTNLRTYDELNARLAAPPLGLTPPAPTTPTATPAASRPDLALAYLFQAQNWPGPGPVDLGPYFRDPTWGLTAQAIDDFYPVFLEQDVIGGKRLGAPGLRSGTFLYYNQTWAQELGFEAAPQTPEALQQQACAAAQANLRDDDPANDHTGGWAISTDYSGMLGWLHAFGAEVVKAGGAGYSFDTQSAQKALAFLRGLLDQGCAWEPQTEPPDSDFAARRALFVSGTLLGLPYQEDALRQAGSRDRWTAIPFPGAGGGAIETYGPSLVVLFSTPQEQLASWLFARWLLAPEQQAKLVPAAGSFPLQKSLSLPDYAAAHPQWGEAVKLIPLAQADPSGASWATARWIVSDASIQLFRYYFTAGQVPDLTALMDEQVSGQPAPTITPTP